MKEKYAVLARDLGSSGEGVASIEEYTVFVDGLLPGEGGIVEVFEKRKNFCRAKLLQITRPSEDRIDPICPVFGVCGGCQIMHLNYKAQLKWKNERVVESLKRIGKIENPVVFDTVPSAKQFHYRNKIQLPVTSVNGKTTLGLYKKGSHEVVSISKCFIHNEVGETCFKAICAILAKSNLTVYDEEAKNGEIRNVLIRSAVKSGEVLVMLITTKKPSPELKRVAKEIALVDKVVSVSHGKNTRDDNVLFPNEVTLLEGRESIHEEVLGLDIQLSAESFFQVNTTQAEAIYKKAYELADLKIGEKALDLFCGIGIFGCFLAKNGVDITGVEVVARAIEDAMENAKRNNVVMKTVVSTAETYMKKASKFDVVFVNPPRKGCNEVVIKSLLEMAPMRIIYTSCNPASLARDAKMLQDGGYKPISFHPFDMFPQTVHVETVALFTRE